MRFISWNRRVAGGGARIQGPVNQDFRPRR